VLTHVLYMRETDMSYDVFSREAPPDGFVNRGPARDHRGLGAEVRVTRSESAPGRDDGSGGVLGRATMARRLQQHTARPDEAASAFLFDDP